MKKIVLTLAIALIASTAMMAQDVGRKGGKREHRQPTAAERVDHMAQELDLSEAQKTQLIKIFEDEANLMEQDRVKMGERRKEFENKVLNVLTPEQQTKFKESRKNRHGKGPKGKDGKGPKAPKGKGPKGGKACDKDCCKDGAKAAVE